MEKSWKTRKTFTHRDDKGRYQLPHNGEESPTNGPDIQKNEVRNFITHWIPKSVQNY